MKLVARIERLNISRFMLPIRALKYTPPPPMLFLVHPFVGLVTPLPLKHSAPSLCTGLIHLFIHPSNIYRVLPRVAPRPGDTDEQCAVLASGQSPPSPRGSRAAPRQCPVRGSGSPAPFAAGKRSGRGLANGQARGFREVQRDAPEFPSRQMPPWEPGTEGRERGGRPGWPCGGPAAVPAAGGPRAPQAGPRGVGATMTPGRASAERCLRGDSWRRRLGWTWGDSQRERGPWVLAGSVRGGGEGSGRGRRRSWVQTVRAAGRMGMRERGEGAEGQGGAEGWVRGQTAGLLPRGHSGVRATGSPDPAGREKASYLVSRLTWSILQRRRRRRLAPS